MILLEVHNRIIEELLTQQIESFQRKEKLVEIKTTVIGKFSSEPNDTCRIDLFRFRWCNLPHHTFA